MKVIGYVRAATLEGAAHEMQKQEGDIRAYCKDEGHTVLSVEKQNFVKDNGKLTPLLWKALKNKDIDAVVIADANSVTSELRDAVHVIDEIQAIGKKIITVHSPSGSETFDPTDTGFHAKLHAAVSAVYQDIHDVKPVV